MGVVGVDPGTKHLGLCMIDEQRRIVRWDIVAISPDPKGVFDGLGKIDFPAWVDTSHVVIERQPSKNPRAVRIQHYIEMYAASHGGNVYCIDPKHKLSCAASSPWWPTRTITSWTYSQRKKLSVETVEKFLTDTDQDPAFVYFFKTSKKKDDLADALLHCLAFLSVGQPAKQCPVRHIKAVRPSAAQLKSGKLTQGGLKFLCKGALSSFDTFEMNVGNIHGFCASACRHFETLSNAYVQLGGT